MDKALIRQNILIIVNRTHPIHSDDIRLHLKDNFKMIRSKGYVREILKVMVDDGWLVRSRDNEKIGSSYFYNKPDYAEPELKESDLKLSNPWKTPKFKRPDLKKILSDLRKKVCVMEGCVK